ncbi:MAG: aminotransferase class V-fold PLP-dependent enzyme [Candidatus Dadabacteria bacterium]|nr:aminotransferase class V-fold PLP-dependent enzyme [Candidatus Dadabacteria bacterium]
MSSEIIFKIADKSFDYNQIHKLNYSTFVEEIPQHAVNGSNKLVDKFHDQNTYIVCLKDSELIGMIAVRDERPFSLDLKLDNLDSYLPSFSSVCEIRLLSVKKKYRNKKILGGLFSLLAEFCEKNEYDLALISATTRQLRLYKKLGFTEFGPIVGSEYARYQPMYLTPGSYFEFKKKTNVLKRQNRLVREEIILQPGPVKVSKQVREAFETNPISHRSEKFLTDFRSTKKMLCKLTNAENVEIFMGSGTLANDIVAAQISLLKVRGLVLSNGHFGERLLDHANRFSLDYSVLQSDWGKTFDYKQIERYVKNNMPGWLWFVHCETSTGLLNDIRIISDICLKYSVRLCVDCISSIGSFEFNLNKIYLASGVSGKSLAAYPGLSFVFYNNHLVDVSNNIPRYLDLGFYKNSYGIPFTLSSNLLYALRSALESLDMDNYFLEKKQLNKLIRNELAKLDITPINDFDQSSNLIISLKLSKNLKSLEFGRYLEEKGILISYRSSYLIKNNFIQIVLMGEVSKSEIYQFMLVFSDYYKKFTDN